MLHQEIYSGKGESKLTEEIIDSYCDAYSNYLNHKHYKKPASNAYNTEIVQYNEMLGQMYKII